MPASGAVLVFELALGKLLERHRKVVPVARSLDHRRRVLTEAALAEIVEVAVYLSRPLGGDDDRGVMRVGVLEELVYAWFDHSAGESRGKPSSVRTICSSRFAAWPRSSLRTRYLKSPCTASSCSAVSSRMSIASAESVPL